MRVCMCVWHHSQAMWRTCWWQQLPTVCCTCSRHCWMMNTWQSQLASISDCLSTLLTLTGRCSRQLVVMHSWMASCWTSHMMTCPVHCWMKTWTTLSLEQVPARQQQHVWDRLLDCHTVQWSYVMDDVLMHRGTAGTVWWLLPLTVAGRLQWRTLCQDWLASVRHRHLTVQRTQSVAVCLRRHTRWTVRTTWWTVKAAMCHCRWSLAAVCRSTSPRCRLVKTTFPPRHTLISNWASLMTNVSSTSLQTTNRISSFPVFFSFGYLVQSMAWNVVLYIYVCVSIYVTDMISVCTYDIMVILC